MHKSAYFKYKYMQKQAEYTDFKITLMCTIITHLTRKIKINEKDKNWEILTDKTINSSFLSTSKG